MKGDPKTQNHKIIFGLKVRQFRTRRSLSFAELAEKTGMSVSYLNEIEKGKKYPKPDKVAVLAKVLEVTETELTSQELTKNLAPVGELLQSNFLNELPLELFGIDLAKVVELIANAPTRVGAFISTLVEISRNYALVDAHFFNGAMRAYQEMRFNYFEEIETAADQFMEKHQIDPTPPLVPETLSRILEEEFGYTIVNGGLDPYPELQGLRSVLLPKEKKLLLRRNLTDSQKFFQLGKELGFLILDLQERDYTSSVIRMKSFDQVLSHYKASYFSAALLINRRHFIGELEQFFTRDEWSGQAFMNLMHHYKASPELFYHRLTNLLPQFFGLQKLFFLRCIHNRDRNIFDIDKELHLNHKHHPHGNGLLEHYCRRWLSLSLLRDLDHWQRDGKFVDTFVGVQRSHYYGTDDEYLCFSLARPSYPQPHQNTSVTIGILIDDALRQRIRFVDDPQIRSRLVNITCERCPIEDCAERAVPATVVQRKEKRKAMMQALHRLLQEGEEG